MALAKPTVLVTRKLPDAVEERLKKDYNPRLNESDERYLPEEIVAKAQGANALLISMTDQLCANLIKKLPDSVRAIATLAVGYDHIQRRFYEAFILVVAWHRCCHRQSAFS